MTQDDRTRPVVAGIDGSEAARVAAAFAATEAHLRGAHLHLLHSLSWPVLRASAEAFLRAVGADAADVLGADRVTWAVVDTEPVTALQAASAEAQLLVVGSRGIGGLAGLLLGSTASGVVAHASCPVVVLPDPTSASVSPRTCVVVGVEGRPGDDAVLALALAEAAARRTELVAVHAWQDAALETAFQSMGPNVDWAGVLADEERLLAQTLAGWRDKEPDVVVREVVLRDRTARALLSVSQTAELLVVGHRQRGPLTRLGSTTHGVLHRAGCPVAVVPVASGGTR